ncbi:MAG: substrate-binding domain-containing protein [Planctomycetes bacterium]|nr:substrate-binding domain-containing protein [Planctomycetota bacterium]MBI3848094.1 substrate-binding domain-containing protein [Planctomycetota bacterium]
MKRLFVIALLGLLAIGCGERPAGRSYRFAIVPKMLNNEVFNYAKRAAEKTAADIEAKEGIHVEILWNAPLNPDPAQQASIVESLAAQKVDGISVSCNEPTALAKAIDAAEARGVPVITFDSDSPQSKRRYFYGTDDIECGEMLARRIGERIREGSIVIQSGYPGAYNLQKRIEGAKAYLAAHHPKITVSEVLYCNDDVKKAIDDVAAYSSARPDLAGWLMVGGWALFGKDALAPIDPAKTAVVAVDALPAQWSYLESGKCQVLLAQNLWGWGAESVHILRAIVEKKPVDSGPNGFIKAPLEVVTRENLADFRKQWAEQFGAPR